MSKAPSDSIFERLVDDFLDRQRRGENPSFTEYCQRHPDLAEEIRDLFPALAVMESLKPADNAVNESLQLKLERIGGYRILGEIARGGMGVVYEAEQESLGRRVALKVLPPFMAQDPDVGARFQREARAAARMHHTNIVPVFEVGQDGDYVFYAMQLIQGQGLDEVIADLARLGGGATDEGSGHRTNSDSCKPGQDRTTSGDSNLIVQSLLRGRFQLNDLADSASLPAKNRGTTTAASSTKNSPSVKSTSGISSSIRGGDNTTVRSR